MPDTDDSGEQVRRLEERVARLEAWVERLRLVVGVPANALDEKFGDVNVVASHPPFEAALAE